MTFLFVLQHAGLLRFFGTTIGVLADRGHRVRIALGRTGKDPGDTRLVETLKATHPGVSVEAAPERDDRWRQLAVAVRSLMDAARYRDPRFAGADKLRARSVASVAAQLRLPAWLVARLASPGLLPLLRIVERAIPTSPRIDGFLRGERPDAVLVSPMVDFGSHQVEYLKSAQRLGIPNAVLVASWDNLTGKGLLRLVPDRVFVWNDLQRKEAVELHGIPPERVVATGAPKFDEWFERAPRTTATGFAARVGLPQGHVLYLCSSPFIAPDEVTFVEDWLRGLRTRSDAPVLVRPHPQNAAQWRGVDLSDYEPVTIWPREGAQPDSGDDRADFFDSLAHARAVVGVNTSGLIEAAVVGKEVFTVLDERFAKTQGGTLHFHYLRTENGGFLHEAATFDEHFDQLLRDAPSPGDRSRFVASFVRPRGVDRPAAPILADEIEALARQSGAAGDRVP